MASKTLLVVAVLATLSDGYLYHVTRPATGAGLCAWDDSYYKNQILPVYNLSSGDLPRERPLRSWTDDWLLENLDVEFNSFSLFWVAPSSQIVITDGSNDWRRLCEIDDALNGIFALASNASLLVVPKRQWQGEEGLLIEMDHLDNGVKRLKAYKCSKLDTPKQICTPVYDEPSDIFANGNRWAMTRFGITKWTKKGTVDLSFFESHIKKVNVTFPLDDWKRALTLLVKSDSQQAIFKHNRWSSVEATGDNEKNLMTRYFKLETAQKICVKISWGRYDSDEPGRYAFSRVTPGQLLESGSLRENGQHKERLEFNLSSGGDYQLDLINVQDMIYMIEDCPRELPAMSDKPVVGCAEWDEWLRPTRTEEAPTDVKLKMNAEELSTVCSALGVSQTSPAEQVKLCDQLHGCVLRPCPAVQPT